MTQYNPLVVREVVGCPYCGADKEELCVKGSPAQGIPFKRDEPMKVMHTSRYRAYDAWVEIYENEPIGEDSVTFPIWKVVSGGEETEDSEMQEGSHDD